MALIRSILGVVFNRVPLSIYTLAQQLRVDLKQYCECAELRTGCIGPSSELSMTAYNGCWWCIWCHDVHRHRFLIEGQHRFYWDFYTADKESVEDVRVHAIRCNFRPKQPNQQSSPAGAIFSGEPFDQLNDYREGLSFWSFVWSLRLVLCANGWCSIVATAQCWGWSCGILLSGLLPAWFLGEILDWVEMYLSRFLVLRKQISCM